MPSVINLTGAPGCSRSWNRILPADGVAQGDFSSSAMRLATLEAAIGAAACGRSGLAIRVPAARPRLSAILGSCVVLPEPSRRRR